MWVSELKLQNVRVFEKGKLILSRYINVLVGPNNAGKSTILKAVLSVQHADALSSSDLRIGAKSGSVALVFEGDSSNYFNPPWTGFRIDLPTMNRHLFHENTTMPFKETPRDEPSNFIYPFLSKRKVVTFDQRITEKTTSSVIGDLTYLYSKIDRLSNPEFEPGHQKYMAACDRVLGFRITALPSPDGKMAAYTVRGSQRIPLTQMGEGVVNILGLIVDLCVAEDKLFLLEEPENDIHPQALKALLELVVEASQTNQFIVTTHSNIVVKCLGAELESKVFGTSLTFEDRLPTARAEELQEPHQRREVLEGLGYSLVDFDLWDAWLFLEESSAEKIIRDYLIPWFVPELKNRLRTFSARGTSEVETKFSAFNQLLVYLHLEPVYKNKAWVILDGGEEERKIIDKLRQTYAPSGWNEDHFLQFKEHNFEKYYPGRFAEKVEELLGTEDRQAKRDRKKALLDEVEPWIKSDDEAAKQEFNVSANEIIVHLEAIATCLEHGHLALDDR